MPNTEKRKAQLAHNTRVYRERHPERVPLQRRKAHLNRRRKAFEKLGGAFCRNCGCDEIEFLELNHKNGGGCQEFKKIGNHIIDMIINGQRNLNDYEVLCRVCNALDYLKRKSNGKTASYIIRWQNFTGQKAVRINE